MKFKSVSSFHHKITHALENALLLLFAFIVYDLNIIIIEYIKKTHDVDYIFLHTSSKFFHFFLLLFLDIIIIYIIEYIRGESP
jgi:hypothetical protein